MGKLLACLRTSRISLENIHFVTFRHNLTKIFGTLNFRRTPWAMGVHRRFGTIYLDPHRPPENPLTELEERRCYWERSFEHLATENHNVGLARLSGESPADNGRVRKPSSENTVVDANVEFRVVLRTEHGPHTVIMGGEIDCCEVGTDGARSYVELKTTRELEDDAASVVRFERVTLLGSWIQSFLGGVPKIVFGFRNDMGILVQTETMGTTDITERVQPKRLWEGGVCLAFGERVLSWLHETAKENEDYLLRFVPEKQRLELLQADTCPESITKHVDELSATL